MENLVPFLTLSEDSAATNGRTGVAQHHQRPRNV